MGEPVKATETEIPPMDRRIDSLIAAHNGDERAVIETILMAYDEIYERSSSGFSRGRIKRADDE